MYLDVKGCPLSKTLAEHISEKISLYVRVAEFVDRKKATVFRMLVDPDITSKQLQELLSLYVVKASKTFKMTTMECIQAPVVDNEQAPHKNEMTLYLRITYSV